MFLDTELCVLCICSFQVKLESIVTPQNLVECFSVSGKPSMTKLGAGMWGLVFRKWMKFVLFILSDNLLDLNHNYILDSSELRTLVRVFKLVCE